MVGYDRNNGNDVELGIVCRNCGIGAAKIWGCYKSGTNMSGSTYVYNNCICKDEQGREICVANVLKLG